MKGLDKDFYAGMNEVIDEFLRKFGPDMDMTTVYHMQVEVRKRVRCPEAALGYMLVRQLKYEIQKRKIYSVTREQRAKVKKESPEVKEFVALESPTHKPYFNGRVYIIVFRDGPEFP